MKLSGKLASRLDSRIVITLVAAVAAVSTAVYATSTNNAAPPAFHEVADVTADNAGESGPALTLPFSLNDLQQQVVVYTPGGIADSAAALSATTQLVDSYHLNVDPGRLQPFLDQAATAATPQQITADANTFLVQQGAPQATVDQAMADIAQLPAESGAQQQSVAIPGQGQGQGQQPVDWLKAIAIAALLAAVLAAAVAGVATNTRDIKCDEPTSYWTGKPLDTDEGRDEALLKMPNRMAFPGDTSAVSTTVGLGIDADLKMYVFHQTADGKQYTFGSANEDSSLADVTNAQLAKQGYKTPVKPHAEQKMATYMRVCAIDSVDFFINNNYVCDGDGASCDNTLKFLLGPGQRLTVHYVMSWTPGQYSNLPTGGFRGQGTWTSLTYVGV